MTYRIPPGLETRRWADYRKTATLTYLGSLLLLSGHHAADVSQLPPAAVLAAHRDVTAFVGTNWPTVRLLERPGAFVIWDGTYGADDFGHDLAVARVRTDRGLWHDNAREHPRTFGALSAAARRFGTAALHPADDGWAYSSAARI